jgi:hypothetical protein
MPDGSGSKFVCSAAEIAHALRPTMTATRYRHTRDQRESAACGGVGVAKSMTAA